MLRLLKLLPIFLVILLLAACAISPVEEGGIAATTAPVAQFARAITEGTGLTVSQVINDSVSCLHDYSLSVRQMELVEKSRVVLISGAGLEETLEDALVSAEMILDCSEGIVLKDMEGHDHDHGHEEHEHHHEDDPHIWLDPLRAVQMAENICAGLMELYPEHEALSGPTPKNWFCGCGNWTPTAKRRFPTCPAGRSSPSTMVLAIWPMPMVWRSPRPSRRKAAARPPPKP